MHMKGNFKAVFSTQEIVICGTYAFPNQLEEIPITERGEKMLLVVASGRRWSCNSEKERLRSRGTSVTKQRKGLRRQREKRPVS